MKAKQFEKMWYAEFIYREGRDEYLVPVPGCWADKATASCALTAYCVRYFDSKCSDIVYLGSNIYQRLTRK